MEECVGPLGAAADAEGAHEARAVHCGGTCVLGVRVEARVADVGHGGVFAEAMRQDCRVVLGAFQA